MKVNRKLGRSAKHTQVRSYILVIEGWSKNIYPVVVELPNFYSGIIFLRDFVMTGGRRPDSDWIQVHADQEYVIEVTLKRLNKFKVSVWYNTCTL